MTNVQTTAGLSALLGVWLVHTGGSGVEPIAARAPIPRIEPPDVLPYAPLWRPGQLRRAGSRVPPVDADAAKRSRRKREKAARRRQRRG